MHTNYDTLNISVVSLEDLSSKGRLDQENLQTLKDLDNAIAAYTLAIMYESGDETEFNNLASLQKRVETLMDRSKEPKLEPTFHCFLELTDELKIEVFSQLKSTDIGKLLTLSKEIYALTQNSFWEKMCAKNYSSKPIQSSPNDFKKHFIEQFLIEKIPDLEPYRYSNAITLGLTDINTRKGYNVRFGDNAKGIHLKYLLCEQLGRPLSDASKLELHMCGDVLRDDEIPDRSVLSDIQGLTFKEKK